MIFACILSVKPLNRQLHIRLCYHCLCLEWAMEYCEPNEDDGIYVAK